MIGEVLEMAVILGARHARSSRKLKMANRVAVFCVRWVHFAKSK